MYKLLSVMLYIINSIIQQLILHALSYHMQCYTEKVIFTNCCNMLQNAEQKLKTILITNQQSGIVRLCTSGNSLRLQSQTLKSSTNTTAIIILKYSYKNFHIVM